MKQLELMGPNWASFEDDNRESGKEKPYMRTEHNWRWEWTEDLEEAQEQAILWADKLNLPSPTVFYNPHFDLYTFGCSGRHVMFACIFHDWPMVSIWWRGCWQASLIEPQLEQMERYGHG